jgi:RNA polymerase sigma factor (sigma-70 family)
MTQQDSAPSPEENVLASEAKKQLFNLCSMLNPPYQEVALDHFFRELSAAEIAAKKGTKLKTIQTQIYRAKAMLKKNMRKGAD